MKKMRYSIEEVHRFVGEGCIDFNGDIIKMKSDRYKLFKEKGVKCVSCGLCGTYYEKTENSNGARKYHFNLYGVENGVPVLFTKDHIMPRSKGGINHISNYQTMCINCNQKKADLII